MKPTKEQLAQFLSKGLSQREIAHKLGSTQTTVGRHMRKYGLKPTRKSGPRPGSKPFLCGCGETDPSKFRKHWTNISYSKCKKCHSEEQKRRYAKRRMESVNHFGGKCCLCGYNKYIGSLHFHHLDPTEKDPNWKLLKTKPLRTIMKELKKCILVCANCHGEIHAGVTKTN